VQGSYNDMDYDRDRYFFTISDLRDVIRKSRDVLFLYILELL
jgi:hypothetical protein